MLTNIIVFGGGSLGLAFSALFSRGLSGSLSMLSRGRTMASVRSNGIELSGKAKGNYKVRAIAALPTLDKQACVLLCVKAYDLESALGQIRDKTKTGTNVVLLQNGFFIKEKALNFWNTSQDDRAPVVNFIRAVTSFAATRLGPNKVNIVDFGTTYFGQSAVGKDIKDLWCGAGLPAETRDDISLREVKKGIANSVINPLTALYGVKNAGLLAQEEIKKRANILLQETVDVFCAGGYPLDVREERENLMHVLAATRENYSSMLQDKLRRRETEIDYLNGVVLSLAHKHGLATPENSKVFKAIKNS